MKTKSMAVNAILNSIRQILGILFPLITFPYVSRILENDGFGKYNYAWNFISYFLLFSQFGIPNFAIRECSRIRNDRERISAIACDLFTINIITSLMSYVALIGMILCFEKLHNYSQLLSIMSIGIGLSAIGLDWINTVFEDYLYITIRYVVIQLIALVFIFLFVRDTSDLSTYCLIVSLGTYSGNLINIFYVRRYVDINVNFHVNFKKYLKPLLTLFLNSLAVMIYVSADILMLGIYVGDKDIGCYSLASRIYNLVKTLVNALIMVTVPRLAFYIKNENERYYKKTSKVFEIMTIFVVPIAVGLFCLSPSIINIIGGSQYYNGVSSLRLLSFSIIFAIFGSIYSECILIINRREKECLFATVISAILNVLLNVLFIPLFGIVGAAITTVIAEAMCLIIKSIFSRKYMKNRILLKGKTMISSAIGGGITMTICVFINKFVYDSSVIISIIKVIICVSISCILYLIYLKVVKNEILNEYIQKIRP